MNFKIVTRPEGEVFAYAAEELYRCLKAMDDTVCEGEGGLTLSLALIDGDKTRDTIDISVAGGAGVIGGTTPVAVLIAAYRFLYELGCRWTHPGAGGEHIPVRALSAADVNVRVSETPSRRHRGVCLEGGVSIEHVIQMIEFLPRVGMNAYFIQFFRPTVFFQRFYEHWHNPTREPEKKTVDEIDAYHERMVAEIKKRGLAHHAVGHGWTCVPFGVEGEGWHSLDIETLPKEYLDILAELDGERKPWRGVPLNSNLCYSRADVRTRVATAVADYCEKNPSVSVLHLWLADGNNNNCECPACRDTRPSDHYVMLLNEVDELLTARGLDTKVVFLAYVDLMWAPEREVIKNPDRFLLMFAPITRTYSQTLREGAESAVVDRRPFELNKLVFPRDVATNIAYLNDWRKSFTGSGFIFDYHLMWDHMTDPGYTDVSRTLFADMQDLDLLGLDGMISCQLSRSAYPTGLPIYGMARALWDKNADFDAMADEYFVAEYGDMAADVRAYLEGLTRLFDPPYLRGECPRESAEHAAQFAKVAAQIDAFLAAHPEIVTDAAYEPYASLAHHAASTKLLADLCEARAKGEDVVPAREAVLAYIRNAETEIEDRIDVWNFSANLIHGKLK